MHILNRLIVVAVLVVASLPLVAAQALTAAGDRYQKQEKLYKALDEVSLHYQSNKHLSAVKNRSAKAVKEVDSNLPFLARQKREVRLQRAAALHTLRTVREEHGIDLSDEEHTQQLFEDGEEQLKSTIRYLHLRGLSEETKGAQTVLRRYLVASLGERIEQDMRESAMLRARARLLGIITMAKQFNELEEELNIQHEELAGEYLTLLEKEDSATEKLHASASEQAEIQRIVAEVQEQILKMQSELARIDARIQRRVERDLIEKGIITTREGSYNDGKIVGKGTALTWPIVGRLTAGFMEPSYKQYFGVPHKAVDIAAPQGTPVRSAADGVVFLARDGGQWGYSYILIGHRGGTATLYGHISQINVTTGQDVSRGEIVGLSGGTPGTYGAGPMTTGPHLHVEVIQNGEHVDPLLVLPKR